MAFMLFAILFTPSFAHAVAINITIPDGLTSNGNPWYKNTNEDQEVEPGNETGQKWDLEAFFQDGSILTIVGGFDFKDGVKVSKYLTFESGDIFIDVTGDAIYGADNTATSTGWTTVANTYGYDYVYDVDFETGTYTLYALTDASTVTVYYSENSESNPYRYASGGTVVATGVLVFTELDNNNPLASDFEGKTHYALSVSLDGLPQGIDYVAHYTIGCGNDNLMGEGQTPELAGPQDANPVPEPQTIALLLSGVVAFGVRKRLKKAPY
jgi:hypothetical protein